ncbi:hypothetical protein JQV19_18660 [Sulfitobacter mediterraneus]|uniref:hypothetical protein n=1 Tax=Sulfitobacter mediterraneus TaxID=83219 RepID=UPI00193A662B|nr:hypothetical protein [Sulfitobacter mediterraneus]MBM1558653.1 hypothetical protein [Sulfitobacter mediterraneus]MBM1570017.1 hypothetical protein [Sulfitobacter mediterraneus]MBM1573974.1 hypothetical protein [Sulfitobacter mediterraneus]MBM1577960.1 hypothetical protein [Sulfitobacter mediterraneus]MBM1581642.1 hypothetical protein [Sulfitobacter mediterraneus]
MTTLIYFLALFTIVGLFVTIYRFFKFLASFLSLISKTNEVAREAPCGDIFTGGFLSMWRVLRHQDNAHARKTLLKNGGLLICSFALTMGAAWMLVALNSKHCALGMTKMSSAWAEIVICGS